jgi:hypothetical protein
MSETARQQHPVEKRIKPLVQALNRPGLIRTLASSEGHPGRRIGPYVYFSCAVGVAAQIVKCLKHLHIDGRLSYSWEVVGRIDHADGCLRFRLQAPALESMGFKTNLLLRISRDRLDKDLHLLAKEVKETVEAIIEGYCHKRSHGFHLHSCHVDLSLSCQRRKAS